MLSLGCGDHIMSASLCNARSAGITQAYLCNASTLPARFTAFCAVKCLAKRTHMHLFNRSRNLLALDLCHRMHVSSTCAQELVLALRASGLATVIITNGHPEIQAPPCKTKMHSFGAWPWFTPRNLSTFEAHAAVCAKTVMSRPLHEAPLRVIEWCMLSCASPAFWA